MSDESSNFDKEMFSYFLDDSMDGLSKWESYCLEMKQTHDIELLDGIFRVAHSLKGGSKVLGLKLFSEVVHRLEDFIKAIQEQRLTLTDSSVKLFLDAESVFRDWLEAIPDNPSIEPPAALEILQRVDDLFQQTLKEPETLGEILVKEGDISEQDLQQALNEQNRKLGEILVENNKTSPDKIDKALEKQKKTKGNIIESIRVGRDKIDLLMDLVGELTIANNILQNDLGSYSNLNYKTHELMDQIDMILSRVQEATIDIRLIPLEAMFRRLERVACELSSEQNKDVEITKIGEFVTLDKTVVDKVVEPLIHIVRNSIDHGIEPNAVRVESGKSEKSKLIIEAKDTSGNVLIKVTDDGKGIDPEVIFKKATEKGLISGNYEDFSKEKILNLLFAPGFSTAEVVTDVSGRGVGTDIVKSTVKSLGGSVWIDSIKGQGTTFYIQLPTNLSLIEAFIVRTNKQCYAVPAQDISEVINLEEYNIQMTANNQKLLELRGEKVIVENVSDHLKVGNVKESSMGSRRKRRGTPAVVVISHNGQWAFELEEVIEKQTVFVKPLGDKIENSLGLGGSTILANGEPCMILQLTDIIRRLKVAA